MHDIDKIYSVLLGRQYFKTLFSNVVGNTTIPSNGDFIVCCQLHKDDTPSFSISTDKPLWHCFGGCGGGDWIKYLEKKEGWTAKQAIAFLCHEAGLSSEQVQISRAVRQEQQQTQAEAPKEEWVIDEAKFIDDVTYWDNCHDALLANKQAQAFLLELRGINLDTIKRVGIGIDAEKRNWVFPVRSIEHTTFNELLNKRIPILMGFEFRRHDFSKFSLDGKECKCIKAKGTPSALCAIIDKTPEMNKVIVIEGFIDAYLYVQYLTERGVNDVWVLSPSCGLSRIVKQMKWFAAEVAQQFSNVTIMLDNDYDHINSDGVLENIGFNKMKELNELFPEWNYNCLPVPYKDFNQYYLAEKRK